MNIETTTIETDAKEEEPKLWRTNLRMTESEDRDLKRLSKATDKSKNVTLRRIIRRLALFVKEGETLNISDITVANRPAKE